MELLFSIRISSSPIVALKFVEFSHIICGKDNELIICDLLTRRSVSKFSITNDSLINIDYIENRILCNYKYQGFEIFDFETKKSIYSNKRNGYTFCQTYFNKNYNNILTSDKSSKNALIMDIRSNSTSIFNSSNHGYLMSIRDYNKNLICAYEDGTIIIFNKETYKPLLEHKITTKNILSTSMVFNDSIYVSSNEPFLYFCDFSIFDNLNVLKINTQSPQINSISVSETGIGFAGSHDGKIYYLSEKGVFKIKNEFNSVNTTEITAGKVLIDEFICSINNSTSYIGGSSGSDGCIRIWNFKR